MTGINKHYSHFIQVLTGLVFAVFLFSCRNSTPAGKVQEDSIDTAKQIAILKDLVTLTNNAIPEVSMNDSLAFLILPVEASCPTCRDKTIDSIVKYQNNLSKGHFIIISANGGRKTISSFFRERDKELPSIENRLFLDSTNQAFTYGLFEEQPTIYYTHNGKVYEKVASLPSTIKEDLHRFFSASNTVTGSE